jgi:hypothetical protein
VRETLARHAITRADAAAYFDLTTYTAPVRQAVIDEAASTFCERARDRSTNHLTAAGLRFSPISTGPGQPGFNLPSIVGPFNYLDVRASISAMGGRPHPSPQLPFQ